MYKELKIAIYLKHDVRVEECGYMLSKLLSDVMAKDEDLLKLHKRTGFKYYSFDNLYPLAKNEIYTKDAIYTFRLRSINEHFINKIRRFLSGYENNDAKIIMASEKKCYKRQISDVISLTPIIVTLDKRENGFNPDKLKDVQDDIIKNLVNKYNSYYGDNIEFEEAAHMFLMGQRSSKLISVKYKNVKLLGIKYKFKVAPDDISQKLAFFAEAVGLGEKSSSCGAGFCHAEYSKGVRI